MTDANPLKLGEDSAKIGPDVSDLMAQKQAEKAAEQEQHGGAGTPSPQRPPSMKGDDVVVINGEKYQRTNH